MAGFAPCPLSSLVTDAVRNMLNEFNENYRLQHRDGALYLGWKSRAMCTSSAWRCYWLIVIVIGICIFFYPQILFVSNILAFISGEFEPITSPHSHHWYMHIFLLVNFFPFYDIKSLFSGIRCFSIGLIRDLAFFQRVSFTFCGFSWVF